MIRRPPRSTLSSSSAASDVYKRQVDGVADGREHPAVAETDIADDHLAAVNADAELERLAQVGGELVIHVFNVRGDERRRAHRLPAGRSWVDIEPEQSQQPVADELIGLTAGVDHGLRGRAEKPVNQENHVEWQPRLGEFG